MTYSFRLDGVDVTVEDQGQSLLDTLRDHLGCSVVKDGCSPQGQCGCCTVWVDDAPRVACVTPTRRVVGREVRTVAGLPLVDQQRWGEAFACTGASQCGFCTPGIVMRLEALRIRGVAADDTAAVEQALLAHQCRCTGWRTVIEAWAVAVGVGGPEVLPRPPEPTNSRDWSAAARRAGLEGGIAQRVGPSVALGDGGFASDSAPSDALFAVPDGQGDWALGETLVQARASAVKVQGRRTTKGGRPAFEVPPGDWDVTLQTGWVEPGYLETDASWCRPGGEPASPLGNGGAFGAKVASVAPAAARELANRTGRAVRVLLAREDCVRFGPKRPPLAAGLHRGERRAVISVAALPGVAEALRFGLGPGVDAEITEVAVAGPTTSLALRAAGWAEGVALRRALAMDDVAEVVSPSGSRAQVSIAADGSVSVQVSCGDPLDEIVLRSYCIGAVHMAASWVTSESIAVDDQGQPLDLTIRSFAMLRAVDTPAIEVVIDSRGGPAVNGSDAVFAAAAGAVWAHQGFPPVWPTKLRLR